MSSHRTPLPVEGEPAAPSSTKPAAAPPGTPAEPMTLAQIEALKERIVEVLCKCFDPEIPVNIYELGLIYDITIAPSADVGIRMTLTSPACPVAGSLPGDVRRRIEEIDQVRTAQVDVVWEPPWDKNRMSEAAKLQLGIDD